MKKRVLSIFLVMALLIAAASITAMAAETVAPNDVSAYASQTLSAALASVAKDGAGSAYCPVCNKTVTWYSTSASGNVNLQTYHWFIQGDMSKTGYYYVESGKSACFYLNGHNVTSSSVAFETNPNATLNIIGNGNETVTGAGYGDLSQYGDTLHTNGGTMNLYGGIYQKSATDAGPVVGAKQAYNLNVYNGTTIQNGTNNGYPGGNIGMYAAGTKVNIYGGTVSGGTAARGGNICVTAADCTLNLSGGEVKGGEATSGNGGNVVVEANSLVNINGGTVTGGTAGNWGGNFYGEGGARFVMTAGIVQTGTATTNGGNFGIQNAYLTLSGGTVKNGTAANGGNLYLSQYVGGSIGGATITGGTLEGGSAANGGSICMEDGSKVSMTGISISGGNASIQGGNIFTGKNCQLTLGAGTTITGGTSKYQGGSVYTSVGTAVTISGATIDGGTSTASLGGSIALENSTMNMTSGTIKNGTAANGGCVYLFGGASMTLSGGTLEGGNATAGNGGNIYATGSGTATLSGGTVTGGTATNWGGNCYADGGFTYVMSAGTVQTGSGKYGGNFGIQNAYLTLSGGTIKNGTASDRAGNLYLSQYVGGSIGGATITGGTVEGGSAVNGGSVFLEPGAKVTMTGVTFTGGTASSLGGVFHISNAQLTLENCQVSGGKASTWGGNIYMDTANAVVTLKGTTTVSDGEASNGGNIAVNDKATLKIESGTISGGTVGNYGGNIFMNSGTLTQTGGTVSNGTSNTDRGGSLYVADGATANISNATYEGGNAGVHGGNIFSAGATTLTNTNVTGGNAKSYGGNIAVAGGTFAITGGAVSDGTASGVGGNVYTWSAATSVTFNGVTVENGTAPTGGNFYLSAVTTFTDCELSASASLSGNGSHFYNDNTVTFNNCTLTNGTVMGDGDVVLNNTTANFSNLNMRKNILTVSGSTTVSKATFNEPAGLHVKSNFTGNVNFASMVGAPEAPIYGKALGANYTAEGSFTGKIICTFDVEGPWACNKNGALVVAACRSVKDGVVTWYADSEEALAGGEADYLWPVIDGTMVLSGDCVIDLAGTNQTITGDATVTLFDSANADYKTYGTATLNGPTLANGFATEVMGNTYYTINNNGTYTFHRLHLAVNGVSLRPGSAGIYYTSIWNCDDLMQELVQSFGVAVSVKDQPDAGFVQDLDTLYTKFDTTQFESGVTKTSVLINEIFKTSTASNNTQRGMKPIYATAYIMLRNGEDAVAVVDNANTHHSLHDVLTILDNNIYEFSAHADALKAFMTKWNEYGVTGDDWNFSFSVPQEVAQLNTMYAGKTSYQGEMHEHANTGGRSDGKQTLETWIAAMKKLDMDFATIVDHDQSRHMYLDAWDDVTFLGGTETTGWLTGKETVSHGEFHMNLVFAKAEQFEAFIAEYADVFKPIKDETTGGVIFKGPEGEGAYTYLPEDKDYLMELAAAVRKHGGFFAHVHPKQTMQSTDIEDYWFGDFTGLEVQYTYLADRNSAKSQANYQLWKDLLAAGKKIYATAGNDEHDMPTVKALTTVYATGNTPEALIEQMRAGNFNPGPMGIRMAIGDIAMGGVGDFTGKKLVFAIGDIHKSELAGEHNYRVDLYKGGEVVESWNMPATGETFYQVVEIDETADFYRLEIIDTVGETEDRVALSQPIWNAK